MANIFTRALDVITPWDRGGEVQRRQEKKKRDEEEAARRQNASRVQQTTQPTQRIFDQPLKVQRPVNIFESLNKNLTLGQANPGVVPVFNNAQPVQTPKPGTIVRPTIPTEQQQVLDKIPDPIRRLTAQKAVEDFNKADAKVRGFNPLGDLNRIKNVAVDMARSVARVPVQVERSALQAGANIAAKATGRPNPRGMFDSGEITNPIVKFLLGKEPVKTYQTQGEELSQLSGQKFGKTPNPALIAPVLAGLDIFGFGKGGPVEQLAKNAAKTTEREAIEQLLTNAAKNGVVLDDAIKNRIAGELVDITDKKTASEIIRNAVTESADKAATPRPISVRNNIPVDEAAGGPVDVPVQIRTPERPTGPIISDVSGGARQVTPDAAIAGRAAQIQRGKADAINAVRVPGRRLEDVTPRPGEKPFTLSPEAIAGDQAKLIDEYAGFLKQVGEGNGVDILPDGRRVSNNVRFGETGGKRMSKAAWREEAARQLQAGEADPLIQSVFNDTTNPEVQSLLAKGERPTAPVGSPIAVKEVTGIPVTDQINVSQNLPETPGMVRVTEATAPSNAKSAAAAAQPTVSLPREVQVVLDNPKQFNKRQVAAARNQRKLAMQMAKTQEQTAEALSRIETASPAAQSGEGFVPTGEFGKSVNGGPIQKVSRAGEMAQAVEETANMSPQDVLQTARTNQGATGGFNRRDIRNIAALFESKRLPRGSAEWNEARQILKEDGTVWGQTGALRNYTMRRNATTDELIGRYESKLYRLADDPTKIESKWFDEVEAAEDAYVTARDDAAAAYNEFTRNPTSANAQAYHAAQDVAEQADRAAKQVEYSVANKALKGNKDVQQIRELDKMANEADLYQMDAVDASMLSGTGTFIRNFVNSAVGGVEESLFGRAASRISGKITKNTVGGGVGRDTLSGFREGASNLRSVASARASNAGRNPLEHIKNWATTGNQLGDTVIDSQVKHNVLDHYTQLLKDQGYAGRELTDRASVMARQDPDNLAREYAGAARVSAGLGAGITRNNKVETLVKNVVSDAVSAGRPTPLSEATGKLVARMTIGFPTAIGRSTIEGAKRFTLGAPTFIKAMRETDPLKRSLLIKEGIKQAGTGTLLLPPMFYALGNAGMISGAYPSDPAERAQWEREGKTENSIKIGGAWYQLPAYLGAWAVPGLFYASLGRNGGNFSEATADVAKAIPSILPTDQASNIMDVINGRTDLGKFMAQTGAGTIRAVTPAGALLNQFAKAFDPTKNDTNSGTNIENFFDKVASGIPGVNNMAGIPDKTDDAGNVITNPNALEVFGGAASDVQGGGEERSRQIQSQGDSALQSLTDRGVFDDPNIKEVLDGKELAIYNKIKSGKKLKEGELDDLQKAFVKGVSQTGDDTAYLEREQYDSNLRALQLKRELMNSDKTVKPSELKKMDDAIKRGEVYRDNEIPYDLISEYQNTGVEEWRKMGDPEDDAYDPERYQRLFDIDNKLTAAGVSYKKGALDKPKYFAKDSKGKGGGKSKKQLDTSFGTLKDSIFAPRVQQYSSIDAKSGSVPIIRAVRPNIIHKITSSG